MEKKNIPFCDFKALAYILAFKSILCFYFGVAKNINIIFFYFK